MDPALGPCPGSVLVDDDVHESVSRKLYSILRSRHRRFPGTQPTSFSSDSLAVVRDEEYWVCEKTDGTRYVLFVEGTQAAGGHQRIWLINRNQQIFSLGRSCFPHWHRSKAHLNDTVIDGELVVSTHATSGKQETIYHAFDCLALDGKGLAKLPFYQRYDRLNRCVVIPYRSTSLCDQATRNRSSLNICVKPQERSYDLQKVIGKIAKSTAHRSDGFIFSSVHSSLYEGRNRVIKWKPPNEISIDFRIERAPLPIDKLQESSNPEYSLYTWNGGDRYEYFDQLIVIPHQFKRLSEGQSSVHGRIVEVTFDRISNQWTLVRIRDDKQFPNHRDVVCEIMKSIKDGVDLQVGHHLPDSYYYKRIVGVQHGKREKLDSRNSIVNSYCHGNHAKWSG